MFELLNDIRRRGCREVTGIIKSAVHVIPIREDVVERICSAGDFLATIYHHLGIDAAHTLIKDFNGRPTPIVDQGRPIAELLG